MTKPKWIVFDFWNTLMRTTLDSDEAYRKLLDMAGNDHGATLDDAKAVAVEIGDAARVFRSKAQVEFTHAHFVKNLTDRLGLDIAISEEESNMLFVNAALDPKPETGAAKALAYLKARNIKLGIVSNSILSGKAMSSILGRYEMLDFFEFVMTSADFGFRKPHPQIYVTIMGKTCAEPEEIWFIGDWIRHDVAGAQNCGMKGVWYNPNDQDDEGVKPDAVITSWDQISGLID